MERKTRQRLAIRDALTQARRPLLPQELLQAAAAAAPGLSLATVYRTLLLLVEEGEVRPVELPGENTRYEPADRRHHHHFQCRACQRVFDVDACPGDMSRLAPQGFVVEAHELTLYGRCDECGAGSGTRTRGKFTSPAHGKDRAAAARGKRGPGARPR